MILRTEGKIGEGGTVTIEPNEEINEHLKEMKNVYVKIKICEQLFMFDSIVDGGSIKEENLSEFKGKDFQAIIYETE